MKNKTFTSLLLASILAVPMTFLFTGCKDSSAKVYAADKQDVYAFSALTSAKYLKAGEKLDFKNFNTLNEGLSRPETINEDIDKINSYVGMFQGYLLNDGISPTVSIPSIESDGEIYGLYSTKLSMNMPNGNGGTDTYLMYYTETNKETEEEIDEDDDEAEIETSLLGILLLNGEEFEIKGEKSIEKDGNETEIEIEFTTKSKLNGNNFIVVKQEMEKEEVEFIYAIHENGQLKSKTKIEWENEENKAQLSMQFMDRVNGTLSNIKYNFEEETINGVSFLKVKYKNGNKTEIFTIKDNGSTYLYSYANGYSEEIPK